MNSIGSIVGIVLTLGLGAWLVSSIIQALRTGVANAAGTLHRRTANPTMFLVTVLVQVLFVVACIVGLINVAQRFISQ